MRMRPLLVACVALAFGCDFADSSTSPDAEAFLTDANNGAHHWGRYELTAFDGKEGPVEVGSNFSGGVLCHLSLNSASFELDRGVFVLSAELQDRCGDEVRDPWFVADTGTYTIGKGGRITFDSGYASWMPTPEEGTLRSDTLLTTLSHRDAVFVR